MRREIKTALGIVGAMVLLESAPAFAHSLLVAPQPRDQQDGYKDPPRAPPGTGAPCGIGRVATQPQTTYAAGQALHVQWSETIDHPGCFVIDFAAANDASFQILGVKSHSNPVGGIPRAWSLDVVLPSAPCPACTLRLRQLMLPADVPDAQCPPAVIPVGDTYYSCANVTMGASADAGVSTDAGARVDASPFDGRPAGGTGGRTGTDASATSSSGGAPVVVNVGTGGAAVSAPGGTGVQPVGSGGSSPSRTEATGGSASSSSSGGSGGPTGTASTPSSGGSGGGCSMLAVRPTGTGAALGAALCLAGAFVARRRRASSIDKRGRSR